MTERAKKAVQKRALIKSSIRLIAALGGL